MYSTLGSLTHDEKSIKGELTTMLCMRLRESWLMIRVLSFADAEQRVRATFKLLSTQYGVNASQ